MEFLLRDICISRVYIPNAVSVISAVQGVSFRYSPVKIGDNYEM